MSNSTDFDTLAAQLDALFAGERDPIANAANLCALLHHALPATSWTGCYFLRGDELVLGPFQGPSACVRIELGKGVCGTAAAACTTQRVADVHQFDGHIACDARARSELVVPLVAGEELIGVLDLDSHLPERFTAADQAGVERLARRYVAACDFSLLNRASS